MSNQSLYNYLLLLGDNTMILGHRLSELCGHGPSLETDIALTNISLDLFGQVRSIFQYAAKLQGGEATEDTIAMLRKERTYRNTVLVEQPNEDFAHVICRQYLFDQYHMMLLESLTSSSDETLNAIAHKSIKESRYHVRFSSEWMKRLAGGTDISFQKMQQAVTHLYPFCFELFVDTEDEKAIAQLDIGPLPSSLKETYFNSVNAFLTELNISVDNLNARQVKGKSGIHSENMGYILAELQFMQRTYPNMKW